MEEDQTRALSLKLAYRFAADHGLEQETDAIRNMAIDWTLKTTSSVRRGYIVDLFRRRGVFDAFRDQYWAYGKTPSGEQKIKWYLGLKIRFEDYLGGRGIEDESEADSEDDTEQSFAFESDLRDYLANNLATLEPGLKLHHEGDRSGVEYPIDDGRIDILALDKNNRPVVIELKLSRGRNKTIGQLSYYMGWVDEHFGKGPCRGMIVSRDISEDLVVAARRVPDVSLFRYRLSVTVENVSRSVVKG
ncbi:MAG: endonuclease NucS domain-containing protein [Nitrospirota bacterium]